MQYENREFRDWQETAKITIRDITSVLNILQRKNAGYGKWGECEKLNSHRIKYKFFKEKT